MPLITSTYKPSLLFRNTHINTLYKTVFYHSKAKFKRIRINTPDADFLDLDFLKCNSNTLVIAMHGLEGSSNSKYIISICNYLYSQKIDCLAVNFRGCSEQINNHLYSYHSGKTDDLSTIISYVNEHFCYKNIVLLGYSMGGNITLKYLGENKTIPNQIKAAIGISVPCDLQGSSYALNELKNKLYLVAFMKTLKKTAISKAQKFPNHNLSIDAIKRTKTFEEFDNVVTAPLFGFKNAIDYWSKSSCLPFLPSIQLPTLILNALDDTFLSESCFPFIEAEKNNKLFLETPNYGGHVGFNTSFKKTENLFLEKRIYQFIQHII